VDLPEDAGLLRIYVGENDRHGGRPLYEAIVLKARELGLAGATVLRGVMGFGRSSRLHTTKVLRLSDDLPIVVEIVDREETLARLIPWLDEVVADGLVTLERVRVKRYAATSGKPRA
jgi:PII-like signaling protein